MKLGWLLIASWMVVPTVAVGQGKPTAILGTWKFDLKQDQKKE